MKVRRHAWVGGFLAVELDGLHWAHFERSPKDPRVIFCGELGHVRWVLHRVAWKIAVRRDTQKILEAFALRVGVEYSDSSNTTTNRNENEVSR